MKCIIEFQIVGILIINNHKSFPLSDYYYLRGWLNQFHLLGGNAKVILKLIHINVCGHYKSMSKNSKVALPLYFKVIS